VAGSPAPASAKGTGHHSHRSRHVLLLSVDGLHQSDLARYVSQHHHSALAALVKRGTEFTHARTPFPSDSFPGMVGQLTGGNPRTTGVYYDVSYNQWSDKHPAYEILNGPSGTGLDNLFAPEINSNADRAGNDWTSVNSLTRQYDDYKVQAVLNEIRGDDHSGTRAVGVPAIFGMNFQSVSTAEKLPTSDGQVGGYNASGTVPGPLLQSALAFVDRELTTIDRALKDAGEHGSTTVILSAKHGQSPQDSRSLKRINDGTVIDGLNAAWATAHPDAPQPLVAASLNDDGMLLWFSNGDRSGQADAFARGFLATYSGTGDGTDGRAKATDISKAPVRYTAAGLAKVYAGSDAASFIGTDPSDGRVPDLIGIVQHGVVYTGKTKKIAEHGGNDPQDRDVPLVISWPSIKHRVQTTQVQTTQIAPTILSLLGLDPHALEAVVAEGTRGLPLR